MDAGKKEKEKKKVSSTTGGAKVEKSLLPLRFDLCWKSKSEYFSFQVL